jgi:hypothetical protein
MMSEHELERLLGGFATDTLTPEEKQRLYNAALQDQQLFNALADEQALKELLTDPVVRRRLLQALNQTSTSGAGGSLSWLDWFRRPASLAFAGGLAAAIFAVVLGTKIYQDSLKQAARSVATEDTTQTVPPAPAAPASQPARPQAAESKEKIKNNLSPAVDLTKKAASADTLVKREQSAQAPPKEQRASDAASARLKQRSELDEVRKPAEAPVAALGKSAEEATKSADKELAASSVPPIAPTAPAPLQAQASGSAVGAVSPNVSARALFYGGEKARSDGAAMIQEPELAMKPSAAPGPQANRPEQKKDEIVAPGKSTQAGIQLKPLGLRYSLIMLGPGGIDIEVDPSTPVGKDNAPRLTVQTNETGYLSVSSIQPTSNKPTALFPSSGEGYVTGGKTIVIPLASIFEGEQTAEQPRLLVWFSRSQRVESSSLPDDRNALNLLVEHVAHGQPGTPAEYAVYVVNPAPTPSSLVLVEIPLAVR